MDDLAMSAMMTESPEQSGADSAMRMNDQVRQLIMQVGQMASQIPEAQAEFAAAAKALTAASLKLVAGQQGPSPSQPVVGA